MTFRFFGPGGVSGLAVGLLLGGCQAPTVTKPPTPATMVAAEPVVARSKDAFVVLSGGGTPLTNNYSQYLQARALAGFFEKNYPREAVWVFFGQGNREGEPAVLADAYRRIKRDGAILDTWEPGVMRDNRAATKENFLKTLRTEILPRVRDGGTLYLYIGDHGELSRGDKPESAVTMWAMKNDPAKPNGWFTEPAHTLTVTELRQALDAGLGSGRVVFCMTQCHSGGFHYLGVPRAVEPETDWFTAVPDWAMPSSARPLPLAAGFTATDEESLAAGCDPDPDPERWAGYERFAPENLLGVDLFSMTPAGERRTNFADAHVAATLVDQTIDKPRSTSEQYLERWATLIETKLAKEKHLTPATRRAVDGFERAVDTGQVTASDPAWQSTQTQFAQFVAKMGEQNAAAKALLLSGKRTALEAAIGPAASRAGAPPSGPRPGTTASAEVMKAWREVIRPAWKKAVLAGEVVQLPAGAMAFEKRLLTAEDAGKNFMFAPPWPNPMLNDIYWGSTYAIPEKYNAGTADAVSRWAVSRRSTILAWAAASSDEAVKTAVKKIPNGARRNAANAGAQAPVRTLNQKTAAERALFYRRVLAAWAFLLELKDQPALEQLAALRELERTALPKAAKS